jgi:nicotinamide-nucleotide amidase
MTVELISVGTELLLGNIVNTNANYLSKKCAEMGLSLYYQVAVGDNETRLCEALETALTRSDIVILTGGLGPTKDDITKEVAAKVLFRNLIEDSNTKDRLIKYFQHRFGITTIQGLADITENNWKQFMVIEDSIVVDNDNGTAPGFIVEAENKRVILLPGPPNEMIPMFHDKIMPYLRTLNDKIYYSKMVKICGIGESKAETMILDMIDNQTNPTIAPYAKNSEVHFRVTASADSVEEADQLIQPVITELKNRFNENIYTTEEAETLESVVVELLTKYGLTISTAESCTGGLFTGRIVNVPGASEILKEGYITYSNEVKIKNLGVNPETLQTFGAVSEQCAGEMAAGVMKVSASDVSIAITGIAGPDGGTPDKPVGLVYIGCFVNEKVTVKEYRLKGNRQKIRELSVIYAMDLLRRNI